MIVQLVTTVAASFVASELIGYLFHRLAHVPGTSLYKSHMVHHLETYPHERFLSDKYIHAGRHSFVIWFVPVFLLTLAVQWFMLPFYLFVPAMATTSLVAWFNSRTHDAFHVRRAREGETFSWMRRSHEVHHRNMRWNFGIYWFFWDRVFGTFRKPSSAPPPSSRSA